MTKRAVIVGINNFAVAQFQLHGCVYDANSMLSVLTDLYGFSAADITILTDAAATRDEIMRGLRNMVSGAAEGDHLVFFVSSHGTQKIAKTPKNQPDGKNDALVTYEANLQSLILDEELHAIFTPPAAAKASVTAIYDCCHSGTMIRDVEWSDTGEPIITVQNRCIYFPTANTFRSKEVFLGEYNAFSACGDNETAADVANVPDEGRPRGAFSYALHKLMRQSAGAITVQDLDAGVIGIIKSVTPHVQTPVFWGVNKALRVFN